MCRLSAVVPKLVKVPRSYGSACPLFMADMLLENARTSNKDGFGMSVVQTGETYKKMMSATDGFKSTETIEWMWKNIKPSQVVIGHVRLSTSGKGSNDDRNAHPFRVGDWLLAHNGHFTNYQELHKTLELPEEVVVDSEVALHAMSRVWGNKSTELTLDMIQAGLNEVEGGYALIVANVKRPDRIYLIVGSNPLNVYSNSRLNLVNTDAGLLDFLNQRQMVYSLGLGWYEDLTKTALVTNHAYVLSQAEGLVELGTFVPKATTVTRYNSANQGVIIYPKTPTPTPSGSPSSTVGQGLTSGVLVTDKSAGTIVSVYPSLVAEEVNTLVSFLNENMLTVVDLEEMLVELPTMPTTPYSLSKYQLKVIEGWFAHLKKIGRFSPADMRDKRGLWLNYSLMLDQSVDPYEAGKVAKPEFLVPYYLNSVEAIRELAGLAISGIDRGDNDF